MSSVRAEGGAEMTGEMTRQEKSLLTFLVVVAIVAPIAAGFVLHWPMWVTVLVLVIMLLVPFQARRSIVFRVEQRELQAQAYAQQQPKQKQQQLQQQQLQQSLPTHAELEAASTPPPPQFQREELPPTPLESAASDYDFLFSATVFWRALPRPGWQHANPGALAIQSVLIRAHEITVQEPPHRYGAAQYRLNSALGAILGDGSGFIEAWAAHVQLTLSDPDLARLQKLADVRKDRDIWEYERHHERDKRAYLADDVLKNTGSAVVWWLAHGRDDIDVRGTVDLIGALRQLSAAANNHEVPPLDLGAIAVREQVDGTIPGRVRGLMDCLDLDDHLRALFVRRLAKVLRATDRADAAAEIVDAFDAADAPPELTDEQPAALTASPAESPMEITLDLPRVSDLPPEPEWLAAPREATHDSDHRADHGLDGLDHGLDHGADHEVPSPEPAEDDVPEWADGSDHVTRPDPSDVDSQ